MNKCILKKLSASQKSILKKESEGGEEKEKHVF